MPENFDFNVFMNDLPHLLAGFSLRLLGAIAIWVIGSLVIRRLVSAFTRTLEKQKMEDSLKPFLVAIVKVAFRIMLIIAALGTLGIKMTSFLVVLSSAGLAVGLALSGTLQNFAGGVIILLFKPFKIGHYIEAQGYAGTVNEIQIFNTILKTPDNKTIILPNGSLSTSSLINYSVEPRRRVDWTFGIAYGDDADKAKAVIQRLCDADERILKDPAVFIAVSALADSSVNIVVRAWVEAGNYWPVHFQMNELIYKTFAEEGLNIPFPQMDVHVHQNN